MNLESSYLSLLEGGENGGDVLEQGAEGGSHHSLGQEPKKRTLEEGYVSREKAQADEGGESDRNASSEALPSESKADALNASSLEDFPSEEGDISIPCDSDGNEIEDFDSGRRENGDSESDRPPSRMKIEWEDDYIRMPASDAKKVITTTMSWGKSRH